MIPIQHTQWHRVRSKCINCKQIRACIKVEARAPLAHGPVLVPQGEGHYDRIEYETHGPMVEICRRCLREDIGTLAKFLWEAL